MLSGIGDTQELQALGIDTVHHLPSVGKNMSDHPKLGSLWSVNSTLTDEEFFRNETLFQEVYEQWNRSHSGLLADAGATHLGFFRLPSNSSIFSSVEDPASGPTAPHTEMVFMVGEVRVLSALRLTRHFAEWSSSTTSFGKLLQHRNCCSLSYQPYV